MSILLALLTIFVCRDADSIGGQSKVATVQCIVNAGHIDMIDIVHCGHCGHYVVDTLFEYLSSAEHNETSLASSASQTKPSVQQGKFGIVIC